MTERVVTLEELKNPFEMDGVRLLRDGKREFSFPFDAFDFRPARYLRGKSYVVDGPAEGVVAQGDKDLFFFGIQSLLLPMVASQDFDEIMRFQHPAPGTIQKTIMCVFARRDFEKLRLPPTFIHLEEKSARYVRFVARGTLYYDSAGTVLGILPVPER